MRICEKFLSIQGESYKTGRLCYFIRVSGCNLRCSYCDTEYAYQEGEDIPHEKLLKDALESGASIVEITGGEPLLQPGLPDLCNLLLDKGFEVLVETNGSLDISTIPEGVIRVMDIKCPGSMEGDSFLESNIDYMGSNDEYKFVLSDIQDYIWAKTYYLKRLKGTEPHVSFSPVINRLKPSELWEWIIKDRLDVRFSVQLHKVVGGK